MSDFLFFPRFLNSPRRSSFGFCAQVLLLSFIGFTFAFMFAFIRITSFAGYKRGRAGPGPAAAAAAAGREEL
jgi:hypothetical protein